MYLNILMMKLLIIKNMFVMSQMTLLVQFKLSPQLPDQKPVVLKVEKQLKLKKQK
jgi:hypothetical protein